MLSRQNLLRLSLGLSVVALVFTLMSALMHYRARGKVEGWLWFGSAICLGVMANSWLQLRRPGQL